MMWTVGFVEGGGGGVRVQTFVFHIFVWCESVNTIAD